MIDHHIQPAVEPPARHGLLRFVPSLYQVAALAILGAIFIVALAPRLDTDFWWHLKDGQYISLHHVVPAHDFMSYTLAGHAWTDHEWLAELGLYGAYLLAGLWGPIVLFALIICATFILVYFRLRAFGIHPVLTCFMLAAAFVTSSASWGPRIQMLTLLFLAAYLLIFQRFQLTRDRRLFILLPLIMAIWANVHGGFVLGLAVIAITLAGEWLNRVTRHAAAWTDLELKTLGLTGLGTLAVTMLNPNGFRQLLYPLTFVLPNAYTNLIQESASPNFHMPVIMLFEALLLLLLAAAFVGRPRLNWTHLFLTVAFTHLALAQVRNVAVWAVVVSPLVGYYLQAATPALRAQFPAFTYRRRPVRGRLGPVLNATLLAVILLAYAAEAVHFISPSSLRQAETTNFPRAAVAAMKTNRLNPHVFVSYSWGGYLLWNLFPHYRDYMDSRADTLFTNAILRGYLTMYAAKPGWQQSLDRYHVGTVLVERTAPLAQVLAQSPGWKLVQRNQVSVLYTRG
jgi:hypothetical protein